jgi:hypothetical protein
MKLVAATLCGLLATGIAGAARADPPKMLRDAEGKPVLVYGGTAPTVIAEETWIGEPVVVAKQPAVRDGSGNPVLSAGGVVTSQAAAPLTGGAMALYEVDRYFLVPSASVGASAPPAPPPADIDSE